MSCPTVSRLLATCLACVLILSCQKQKVEDKQVDPAIAEINGKPILQSQLDFELERTLSNVPDIFVDQRVQKRVLDSMILSHLMADIQSQQMDADEMSQLDKEVAAYKQKKLVERYIRQHVEAQPVTKQQVKDYYQKHQQEFGQKEIKFWRRIRVENVTQHPHAQAIAARLSALDSIDDLVNTNIEGLAAVVSEGTNDQDNLQAQFQHLLAGIAAGEISDLQIDGQAMYRIAVTKAYIQPAKPLDQVQRDIQKRLSQQAWKQAIKAHGEKLRAQAEIKINAVDS
ncbi:peptidyl-prolyl cis-trans isomerase [Catenovulum sediminis]|uniref:peptidylprolyl isomerase n=1 Tax=Catenovulum sediminis TaxID=1740262 RepID=A0ABV1REH4_9ALTE|nr:peptidyl-prolyl cis-trans isomerase [Catenovulum sediminis]